MNAKQEMDPRDFTNPLARWLYEAGLEQGEEKGLEKGLEQGEEKGLEKGLGIGRDALLQLAAVVCSPAEMEQLQRIDDLRVMQSTLADTLRDARSGR